MSPRRAKHPCHYPGCPALVEGRPAYCVEHLAMMRAEQDAERGSASARGYDAEWRKVRRRYLKDHPRCMQCGRPATVVHHVVRVRDGGTNDDSNLRALCARCHNAITMREDVNR